MIVVRVYWNVDADGNPIDAEMMDWSAEHAPVSYYGPFKTERLAVAWMEGDYQQNESEIYDMAVVEVDKRDRPILNRPESIYGYVPDRDIRDLGEEDGPYLP